MKRGTIPQCYFHVLGGQVGQKCGVLCVVSNPGALTPNRGLYYGVIMEPLIG